MKIIKSKFKSIIVRISQLLVNVSNNPAHGKEQEQLEYYQNEMQHFGYIEAPIVYKHESLWDNTEQEYIVLTNVQDVEMAKKIGITEMEVLEIDDPAFTTDDAFRFTLHRSYFLNFSMESRYHNLKRLYNNLKKYPDYANGLKTKDGKTISKIALLAGISVGTIHYVMSVGENNLKVLKEIDEGKTTLKAEYRKINPLNPSHIMFNGEEIPTTDPRKERTRPVQSKQDGFRGKAVKHYVNIPAKEIDLHLNLKQPEDTSGVHEVKLLLNGQPLLGFEARANDAGNGYTQIILRSKEEPMEVLVIVKDMREYFKSKGFTPESPRRKLQTGLKETEQVTPPPPVSSNAKVTDIKQDAVLALLALGHTKTKAALAVENILKNEAPDAVSDLVTKALRIIKQV